MEKVITNEMTKFLLILGAGVAGLFAVTANMISKLRGSFKPYRKATILYSLAALFFFALIALAGYPGFMGRPFSTLILFQAYFVLLGSAHFYYMHQYLRWSGDDKAFTLELLFTFLIALFGSIGFLLVYHLLTHNGLQYVMTGSVIFFFIPFFIYHTFRRAAAIPPKIVKEWFYPVNREIQEPEESKMKNLLVISFEFQKQTGDPHFTNFRAKAPVDMDFGQLFYYFINDYNERHANSKINYISGGGDPHGWIFYRKSRWYNISTHYIDAEKTIFNNRIKENDVIICMRSV